MPTRGTPEAWVREAQATADTSVKVLLVEAPRLVIQRRYGALAERLRATADALDAARKCRSTYHTARRQAEATARVAKARQWSAFTD